MSISYVRTLALVFLAVVTVLLPDLRHSHTTTALAKEYLREDEPSEAEAFYLLKRLPSNSSTLPMERYTEARNKIKTLPRYSTSLGSFIDRKNGLSDAQLAGLGNWTQLGPGNIGGRTRALVIAPSNPSLMFASGIAGGVWKSTNAGASWNAIGDMLPNLAIGTLAVDPSNSNIIYAGTGEGFFNIDSQRGGGIFKSTDGGISWGQIASPDDDKGFYYVNKLIISPNNSQRLYAGTRSGIWRSTNAGVTWAASNLTGVHGGCLDLVIRTDRATDTIFASLGTFDGAKVLLNNDAGGAGGWASISFPDFFGLGRISIAIAPSNQNVVYVLASEYNSIATPDPPGPFQHGLRAVFRSTDGGLNWTTQVRNTNSIKLNRLLLSNPIIDLLVECGVGTSDALFNQGWYDNVIAVDPLDSNRLWAGGIDLFRSDDGGANWGLASYWWTDPTDPHYAHADQHAIIFHPQYNGSTNKVMFVANDGGIFRTDDARANVALGTTAACDTNNTSIVWTSLNHNYQVTQFYHGVPYPDNTRYLGGTQDNGTLRGTDATGANAWSTVLGGDGGYVAVDRNDTNILYGENTGLSIKKSVNGGATFTSAISGITENPNNFLFISPFTMDPSNSQRLWTGGRHLWRTTNGATSWVQATNAQYSLNSYSNIAVAPTNPNYVAAGSSDGFVISTKVGLTADSVQFVWSQRFIRPGFVSCVAYDPTDANILYATFSSFNTVVSDNHVYRSLDAGFSFRPIDGVGVGKLPDIPVHYLVVDPSATSHLYIGTDLGIFVSVDWGQSWAPENSGFSDVITESLAVNTFGSSTSLFAFTHGRGAWRVEAPQNCVSLSAATQTFNAAGGPATISVTAQSGCSWTAVSNDSWINIVSGASGNGNGTVSFTVASNTTGSQPVSRTGTMIIAEKIFMVIQTGNDCAVRLSPQSQYLTAPAGTGMLDASADGGFCALSAVSNDSWITITSPPSTPFSFLTVQYSYTANPTNSIRAGSITVSGLYSSQTIFIRQAGQGCSYTVSPTNISLDGTVQTTTSISVTATGGCGWTATTSDAWINITSGSSGTGNGVVNLTAAINNTPDTRIGHVIVAGYDVQIVQQLNVCNTYSVSPSSFTFDQYGGAGSFTVTSDCSWSVGNNSTWITLTNEGQAYGGKVGFVVSKNMTGSPRAATLTVRTQTVTVTQEGNGCFMTLSPSSEFFSACGGPASVRTSVFPSCSWTPVSNAPWITPTSGPGVGIGTINYTVAPNTTSNTRTGTMTIRIDSAPEPIVTTQTVSSGITFTVVQSPGGLTINRDHQSFPGNGGDGTVLVKGLNSTCPWVASTSSTFINITSGSSGAGDGSVQYSVAPNPGSTIRSDTITIAGQTYTVYQGIDFADVPLSDTFYTDIGKLSARGVTLGCGAGNYCPNSHVTREEMAAFIMRAKGEFNPPAPLTQHFVDVLPQNQFYNFIDRMAVLQITVGCDPGPPLYCPQAAVQREQMAAFLIRGLGEFNPPTPATQRFGDVLSNNPFYNFIDRMAVLQITQGCSSAPPLYCPGNEVTRAQMAAFLVRAFNL